MTLARGTRCLALLLLMSTTPVAAHGQGFGLNEMGTCAVSRGHAVTGSPCQDASDIYWNPGAVTRLPGWSLYAGVAAIALDGEFTQDTTGAVFPGDVPTEFPPHLFIAGKVGRLGLGVGVFVPYGLTTQWEDDFPGRFVALRASLQTIYAQPTLAWEVVPGWSLGGGPVIGYSKVELRQALDLSQQVASGTTTFGQLGFAAFTEFARGELEGDGTAFGFSVGIHGLLTPTISVGARYLSQLNFEYEDADATFTPVSTGLILAAGNPLMAPGGTPLDQVLAAQFTGTGRLTPQKVSTAIKHPWQAQVGIGFTGIPRTALSFDVARIGWSAFRTIRLDFTDPDKAPDRELIEDYEDSWALRFGVAYELPIGWALRGGYHYISTPTPDVTVTPLLPDQNRHNYMVGVGIPLFGNRFALDAGYLSVQTPGRRGRIVERASRTQTARELNSGWYELSAHIFSVSLKANF